MGKKFEILQRRLMVDHLSRYYSDRLQRDHMRRQIDRLRRLEAMRFGKKTYRRFHFRHFRKRVKTLHRVVSGRRHTPALHSVMQSVRADHRWCMDQCHAARRQLSVRSAKNCKFCQGVFETTSLEE